MSHQEEEDEKKKESISSSSSNDSNPCPICLGPFYLESYLDHCFHKFCYNCILRWRKVVGSKNFRLPSSLKCPLCKRMEEEKKKESISSSSSNESNPCPICLGPFILESYLDHCFHKFCYNCILRWRKVVGSKNFRLPSSLKCPLCKTENFSIIHDYDENSFQRHYINQDYGDSFILSKAHKNRLKCYYTEPGTLNDVFDVPRYWKFRYYLQPNRWLQDWLRREIQALIQEEDVDIILHHILGMIDSVKRTVDKYQTNTPESKQGEFKAFVSDAARPFLTARTDRFVNELELFLASGLTIEAYDEVYMQSLGWNTSRETNEGMEGDCDKHTPVVPYLYIFDEDSDTTD